MSITINFYNLMSYKSNKSDNKIQFYLFLRHETSIMSNIVTIFDIRKVHRIFESFGMRVDRPFKLTTLRQFGLTPLTN